jgi:hypothetical protein
MTFLRKQIGRKTFHVEKPTGKIHFFEQMPSLFTRTGKVKMQKHLLMPSVICSNNYWRLKFTLSGERGCYFIYKRCISWH